ncbi:unnamed protein product [Pylaiella littoralis]
MNGPERGTRTTDSLVKFAIPNFLLLNPGACWTKFGTLKTEYTKGTQAQFDM